MKYFLTCRGMFHECYRENLTSAKSENYGAVIWIHRVTAYGGTLHPPYLARPRYDIRSCSVGLLMSGGCFTNISEFITRLLIEMI